MEITKRDRAMNSENSCEKYAKLLLFSQGHHFTHHDLSEKSMSKRHREEYGQKLTFF
jgi:hypothetical protein